MSIRWIAVVMTAALVCAPAFAQDAKTVLENASKALGVANLKSIEYSGGGSHYALGQAPNPGAAWPRFNLKSYHRTIDYETPALREEMVRTQGENPVRGGGGQPMIGEQRQLGMVSAQYSWNMAGNNAAPAPANMGERLQQIWLTPHGFVKAGLINGKATAKVQTVAGKKLNVVTYSGHGNNSIVGYINDQGLVEKVETWLYNPVLGDMPVEAEYSDYKDYNGTKFPGRIVQKHGTMPVLDVTVSSVKTNVPVNIAVPENVKTATRPAVRVESEKLADGVWYVRGGSHHSVVVDFKDHLAVIEGPQNDERSLAVIAEAKKLIPNKPIRFLVNTHQHFDHSGGVRAFVAEGATIVTHEMNKPYYERVWANAHKLSPDAMAKSAKKPAFVTVKDKHVMTDGARTLEIHLVRGNPHNDGLLMVYLPKEKLLIQADAYNPGAPDAPVPSPLNPFTVNLFENVQRLKLDVAKGIGIHGRAFDMAELAKFAGRGASNQ